MLTPIARSLGEVLTVTSAIDDVIGHLAVGLASNLGRTIRQQLHVTSQHDLDRAIDPAVALWQGGLGLLRNLCNGCTPGSTGRVVAVVGPGIVFPVVRCYNCACHVG